MTDRINQPHTHAATPVTHTIQPLDHASISQRLHRAITRRRLPQVVLFIGPQQQTDTTCTQLAQALHCSHRSKRLQSIGCNQCNNCQRIAKHLHPNVLTLNSCPIGIEQIRCMKQQQNLRSFAPGPQIWLVANAHNLTLQAASALLKLLEEPHTSRFIFLSTPNATLLPATVVSRCHNIFFPHHHVAQPSCSTDAQQHINRLLQDIHQTPRLQRWHISQRFPTNRDELGNVLQQMLQLQWQTTKQLCHQQPLTAALHTSIVVTQAVQETYEAVLQRNANNKLAVEDLLLRRWP